VLHPPRSAKIFVLGTGRSGTHWIGWILEAHPDIHVNVEKPPIFPWVTQIALDPKQRPSLLPKVIRQYMIEHALVAPKQFVDKSHPNLWLARDLAEAFPDARFIGVRRSVYGTVASMLKHEGVMRWIHNWKRFPVPNQFLGIGEDDIATYEDRSLAARCAMRWLSHSRELDALTSALGDKYMVVDYEKLQMDTEAELSALSVFLGLESPLPTPSVKRESLDRWQNDLSKEQIADIETVVESSETSASDLRRPPPPC
jgi:hypothetical protein